MAKTHTYVGVDKDFHAGMTAKGKIVRDAWVFGLIPESQTCEGWNATAMDSLLHRVNDEWDKYGCLVSNLPPDLRARHEKIYREALVKARAAGWSGEFSTDDEG